MSTKGDIVGIEIRKVMWVMDLLTNDEASSDEELAEHLSKEGPMDKGFAEELVKYRTFGDMRKDKAMHDFVYENVDRLEN
jgi:hypothetical protein